MSICQVSWGNRWEFEYINKERKVLVTTTSSSDKLLYFFHSSCTDKNKSVCVATIYKEEFVNNSNASTDSFIHSIYCIINNFHHIPTPTAPPPSIFSIVFFFLFHHRFRFPIPSERFLKVFFFFFSWDYFYFSLDFGLTFGCVFAGSFCACTESKSLFSVYCW